MVAADRPPSRKSTPLAPSSEIPVRMLKEKGAIGVRSHLFAAHRAEARQRESITTGTVNTTVLGDRQIVSLQAWYTALIRISWRPEFPF